MKLKFTVALVAALIVGAQATTWAADTATIHCLSPNSGFTIDGVDYTVMNFGETLEVEVAPEGSLLQLWSCGWDGIDCQWIDYDVMPGTEWNIVPLCDVRIVLQAIDECNYITILNCPPSDDPQSFIDGLTVQINGYTGSETCPPVYSLYWDWGDGSKDYAWFPSSHDYQYPGEYTVCAASFDIGGNLLGIDSCGVTPEPVNLISCEGFAPPMSADHPVGARKNRVLPMMMKLFNSEGLEMRADDLPAAPVIQVMHTPGSGEPDTDVTSDALAAGLGTEGNMFEYRGDAYWHFNLKVSNYSAPGEYLVTVISGDESEYTIDPACVASFLVH